MGRNRCCQKLVKLVVVLALGLTLSVPTLLSSAHAAIATTAQSSVTAPTGFGGLNEASSNCCGVTAGWDNPPDVQIAAGPSSLVEATNDAVAVYDKTGGLLSLKSDSSFFGTGNDFSTDPKILYDSQSQRFFATVLHCVGEVNPNYSCLNPSGPHTYRVEIRVSISSDPTGSWYNYSITMARTGIYPDQPILGLSTDKFVVSGDMFVGFNPIGSEWWVMNKTAMAAGLSVQPTSFGPYSALSSMHPVQTGISTEYMVTTGQLGSTTVQLFTIPTLPLVSNSSITNSTLTLPDQLATPPVGQEYTSGCSPFDGEICFINTNDARVLDTAWLNGAVWLTTNSGCKPDGVTQRACVRLIEINTNSISIAQEFDYGKAGQDYYFPAIRTDSSGNLDLIYGYSNITTWPSLAITGQATTDSSGSLAPARTIVNGTVYNSEANNTETRYGDYFGAAVDPSNPAQVWVAGEYMNVSIGTCGTPFTVRTQHGLETVPNYCWDTFITEMQEHPYVPPDFSISASPSSINGEAGVPVNVTITVTANAGFSGTITFSAVAGPGFTTSFSPTSVTLSPGGHATTILSITANPSCPKPHSVTAKGNFGSLSHNTVIRMITDIC